MLINRRDFLKNSAISLGGLYIPTNNLFSIEKQDHFFINFFISGGLDTTYTFDARDRTFTNKNLLANYMPESMPHFIWEGENNKTLANFHMKNLLPYKDQFSILNGVIMAPSFDGHPQNINQLFTGSAFGGQSYIPHLFGQSNDQLLDYLQLGAIFAEITNSDSSLKLSTKNNIKSLSQIYKDAPSLNNEGISSFLNDRYRHNAKGKGLFSKGSSSLKTALKNTPQTLSRLKKINVSDNVDDELLIKLETAFEYFKAGITNSCVIEIKLGDFIVDTHDFTSAKKMPELSKKYAMETKKIFDFLNEKKFPDQKTMISKTTFLITSEFGRTMRQENFKISKSGTDHNPLTNTVLIGGKGIQSGLIIGETDWQETNEKLSAAHLNMDSNKLKFMGRVFDYKKMQAKTDTLPEKFVIEDYLTIDSIVNTLYKLFNTPKSFYRTYDKQKQKTVPTLSKLLKNKWH